MFSEPGRPKIISWPRHNAASGFTARFLHRRVFNRFVLNTTVFVEEERGAGRVGLHPDTAPAQPRAWAQHAAGTPPLGAPWP